MSAWGESPWSRCSCSGCWLCRGDAARAQPLTGSFEKARTGSDCQNTRLSIIRPTTIDDQPEQKDPRWRGRDRIRRVRDEPTELEANVHRGATVPPPACPSHLADAVAVLEHGPDHRTRAQGVTTPSPVRGGRYASSDGVGDADDGPPDFAGLLSDSQPGHGPARARNPTQPTGGVDHDVRHISRPPRRQSNACHSIHAHPSRRGSPQSSVRHDRSSEPEGEHKTPGTNSREVAHDPR